jgi:predicted LPLAT superfamily acyltransferase
MLVLRHFASFGRILCDRLLAARRPTDFTFSYRNEGVLRDASGSGRGCILLAAHLGNWELSGLRLKKLARGLVHLVMVRGDDPAVQKVVDSYMRGDGISVIDPRDPLGASLAIHAALGRGETVCMLGDRIFGAQPVARTTFLGAPATFPLGPFHAAAIAQVPILVCFLVKVGSCHYRLEVDDPWHITLPPRGPERRRALQAAVDRWAARLERQVRRFPLQWHNFYDFWA